LDSSEKLKDNSRADNTGLTDCYIIKGINNKLFLRKIYKELPIISYKRNARTDGKPETKIWNPKYPLWNP